MFLHESTELSQGGKTEGMACPFHISGLPSGPGTVCGPPGCVVG